MNPTLGFRAFFKGASHSRHPSLRHYTWAPLLVSLVTIGTGLFFAIDYLAGLAERMTALLPGWLSWLQLLIEPLLYLLGVLVGAWSFALLAVVIASPFLGAYSLAIERHCLGGAPRTETGLWTDLTNSLAREARKLLYYLPRLIAVFVLTLIPVLNVAAPVIWLIFGAWTLAVQFTDYPTENRQLPFDTTLEKLRANRAAALAFGGCATVALMIPLLNFLLIPVAVAGGTLLWHYLDGDGTTITIPSPPDARH